MSSFSLVSIKDREKFKGVWLRVNSIYNEDVTKAIKNSKQLRFFDTVWKIEIVEVRENKKILLEVWAKNLIDSIVGKQRNNVFHILINQNLDWSCEGDLGAGADMKF